MNPHPTSRPGLLRIPGPALHALSFRLASLSDRDHFAPASWPQHAFVQSITFPGWWEFDVDALGLPAGEYEYEFVADNEAVVPDPYADTITRFGGYRGLLNIVDGVRVRPAFHWDDEFPPGIELAPNNRIVIYEMPIKWMSSDAGENAPLVELGSFDKVIFEHLDYLAQLGINCIELLPVQDSPQTLNWGYGTRFFFAPDYDLGTSVDARFFVKSCHQRGIRIVLDVVMNMFAPECPLSALAASWFYEPSTSSRQDWGQNLFRFNSPAYGDYYAAREFLYEMAEFWVSEYHADGFRIDDFVDIGNWDFVQAFRDRATARSAALFPAKPFLVIAEDSNRRFVTTANDPNNPNGRKVIDAIWNFGYRDEVRRLLTNTIDTAFGEPARSVRVQHLVSNQGAWNDWDRQFDTGYADMACSVPYITSHDVADGPRLMNALLGPMLLAAGLGDDSIASVRFAVDSADDSSNAALKNTVQEALERVLGGFAILLTSVGMPMFLAGEEFGDVHDTSYVDANAKQQNPVQWNRAGLSANAQLKAKVADLIALRTSHAALHRNEIECFYFHPQFDDNVGPRVFAYCRTGGQALGTAGQVIVVANMGPWPYPVYNIPAWPWNRLPLTEVDGSGSGPGWNANTGELSLALGSFSVRVFRS